ncbi:FAD-dependent oxidoreductase [Niastella vici]|uniref:FAD-dependent oxidoreductase n=1 Tax=Niastella vici TaxID=1703345 RepID=A0A1V9FWW8_9BACT|nr:glycerol-3-phosphate dehydrogenase/oxidase [Niastella vici]OQP62810.1 FAD-dependent oxidoreductase [Niastella vici]
MEVETVQDRNTLVSRLSTQTEWDLIVIGGGATGLGIALEAVSRGYSVLLTEQADFAKGTSSRSTKLVHGGVRYLAQGDIQLVREASIERGLLWRNAPHLVKNQTFIIPVYTWFDRLKYTIGLKLYDWIAGRLSLGSSVFIPRAKALQKLPNIKADGLVGGVQYHDGQFDDSRLAINLVQTIIEQGGVALNYMKVTGLLKGDGQHISGVTLTDVETGRSFACKAKAVINATGVFVDAILHMDNPAGAKSITASQGVHLVLDKKFYPSEDALMIPATSDGRVLFAVPWHGKVVVGTTDTPVSQASLEPQALEREITFILENASRYFVQQPKRSDVLSVFAGLRPLAAPQKENAKTKEISRSHKIMVTPSRLFTILGGKWTTFRKMGEDMVDRVEKELQWLHQKTATRHLAIHGAIANVNQSDPLYFYGSDAPQVKALMNGHANQWLSTSLQIHEAQVIWAVKHEMARTVEDVLSRRTRALLLDAKESIRMAEAVANIMATLLKKDANWVKEQVAAYTKLAEGYLLK